MLMVYFALPRMFARAPMEGLFFVAALFASLWWVANGAARQRGQSTAAWIGVLAVTGLWIAVGILACFPKKAPKPEEAAAPAEAQQQD